MGVNAELVVLGCTPPEEFKHDRLKVIPFLDKNSPKQRQQFRQFLLQSNFLLFPTRAECLGIVVCEANAFGIPVLCTEQKTVIKLAK